MTYFLSPLDIGLTMGLIFSWVVLGLTLSFRLFDFPDLTVEGSFLMGAVVFATLSMAGIPMPVAIVVAIVAGAAAGAMTAFFHVQFGVNKFLSGIIMLAITYSIGLRIMGGSNIGLLRLPSIFDRAAQVDRWAHTAFHPGTIIFLIILLLITTAFVILAITSRKGTRLRVAGSNPDYARSLGISVPRNLIVGLSLTNALAAVSGVLLASMQGFTDIGMGQGVLILALASMTVGERVLSERTLPYHIFVVLGAIVGSVIYQILIAYAVTAGLNPVDLKLATALLVLIVIIARFSKNSEVFSDALR